MKTFVWTFIAVAIGIFVYAKLTGKAPADLIGKITFGAITVKPAEGGTFVGPDIDPLTGAYTPPSARAGTVEFAAQDN